MSKCSKSVSWWDGEYEGTCELPEAHAGPHYDGMSCFDDDSNEVELKQKPIPPTYISISYHKFGKLLNMQNHVLNSTGMIASFQPEPGVVIHAEIKS